MPERRRKSQVMEVEDADGKTRSKARKLSISTPDLAFAPGIRIPQIVTTKPNGHTIHTSHWLSTSAQLSLATSCISFLDLPPETRNHIWEYIRAGFGNGRLQIKPGVIQGYLHPSPYLAQTCWAIRREMLNMIYGPRTFVGEEKELMLCLKPLKADTLRAIGKIELKRAVRDIFGVVVRKEGFSGGAHLSKELIEKAESREEGTERRRRDLVWCSEEVSRSPKACVPLEHCLAVLRGKWRSC